MFNCENLTEGQQRLGPKGVGTEALVVLPSSGEGINIFDRPDPNVRALSPGEYLGKEKEYLIKLRDRLNQRIDDGNKVEE